MKNQLKQILIATTFFFNINSFAQLTEGDVVLDFNYGLIGGVKGIYFADFENNVNYYDNNYQFEYKTNYLGPAAIKLQYMATDNFGIGFETNYTFRSADWRLSYNQQVYDPVTQTYKNEQIIENYNVTQTVIRFMIRTSWEFVNEEKLQVNWANSIGHRRAIWTGDADDYYYGVFYGNNGNGGWPLAFRTAIGIRYWIHENVGLNAELGFSGGSVMNFGVSGKF